MSNVFKIPAKPAPVAQRFNQRFAAFKVRKSQASRATVKDPVSPLSAILPRQQSGLGRDLFQLGVHLSTMYRLDHDNP